MSKVEMWFPVSIYTQEDLLTIEENEKIKEACLEIQTKIECGGSDWIGGTYNTLGTLELNTDSRFNLLHERISTHVHEFAKLHGSIGNYQLNSSWCNISTPGSFQEFHTHNGNVFSAVYYASSPEGSGNIIFEDPKEPDMCSLKNVPEKTPLSFIRISYPPTERMLIIFRAYLRHLVEPGKNSQPRISIAANYR